MRGDPRAEIYAMLPLVKEAEEGYRNFKNYVKEWKENEG